MILLVNGPNLNLLGEREPEIYGRETLADVEAMVRQVCAAHGQELVAFQSNSEGALLDFLQEHRREADGVILNPGALTHTSRALPDCLRALPCPCLEVHLSNIHAREPWRRRSFVSPATRGQIVGLGVAGYRHAAQHLCELAAARAATAPPAPGAAAHPRPSHAASAVPPMNVLASSHLGAPVTERPSQAARGVPRRGAAEPGSEPGDDAFTSDTPELPPCADLLERGDYEPL